MSLEKEEGRDSCHGKNLRGKATGKNGFMHTQSFYFQEAHTLKPTTSLSSRPLPPQNSQWRKNVSTRFALALSVHRLTLVPDLNNDHSLPGLGSQDLGDLSLSNLLQRFDVLERAAEKGLPRHHTGASGGTSSLLAQGRDG